MAQTKVQKVAPLVEKSDAEESGNSSDSSASSSDSGSGSDDEEEGGIPKSKLAGRVRGKKRKSESFRKMFRDD
jgi:hypothetical protein